MDTPRRKRQRRNKRRYRRMQSRILCLSFVIIAIIILLLSLRRCSPEEEYDTPYVPQVDVTFTPHQVQEEETISAEIESLLNKRELSEDEQYKIMSYTLRTSEGIRFYRRATDQGYLSFTVSNVRYLGQGDEWPQTNYLHEAYLELNNENTWVEYDRPVCLNQDGTPKEGWNLVLVDVKVTNHDAAARLGDYSDTDPYLFRGDGVCTLIDLRLKYENNYIAQNIDYFSELGKYPEHYVLYRLEPGESTTFTIGFLKNSKGQETVDPYEYLRLCNTTGNLRSVFMRLDEEGLGKCN